MPPISPAHVLDGEMWVRNFRRPNRLPMKYAPVSYDQTARTSRTIQPRSAPSAASWRTLRQRAAPDDPAGARTRAAPRRTRRTSSSTHVGRPSRGSVRVNDPTAARTVPVAIRRMPLLSIAGHDRGVEHERDREGRPRTSRGTDSRRPSGAGTTSRAASAVATTITATIHGPPSRSATTSGGIRMAALVARCRSAPVGSGVVPFSGRTGGSGGRTRGARRRTRRPRSRATGPRSCRARRRPPAR